MALMLAIDPIDERTHSDDHNVEFHDRFGCIVNAGLHGVLSF